MPRALRDVSRRATRAIHPGSPSVPEGLGFLAAGCAGAAYAYPAVSDALGLETLCPLRALTGIPCPLCGGTTAAVALSNLDVGAAIAANPFIVLFAAFGAAMMGVVLSRRVGIMRPATAWSPRVSTIASRATALLVAMSWVFQLHRFGFL